MAGNKWQGNHLVLSTGKRLYAYGRILGIREYDLRVSYGHDGILGDEAGEDEELTPEERTEIAEHMVSLWTEWAKSGGQDGS